MADRRIKPDEAALWDSITESVKPLKPNKRNLLSKKEEPPSETPATAKQAQKKKHILPVSTPSSPQAPPVNPDANIDKRTLGRLKKGRMPVEARLDLHGHTRDTAHRALNAFIEAAYDNQRRCVLVITGKGLRASDGERGVLRQAVPGWLSSGKLKQMTVSWQPAQPRDGGDGALYVLIRRKR